MVFAGIGFEIQGKYERHAEKSAREEQKPGDSSSKADTYL